MLNPSIRADFPILGIKVNNKPLIYLDNSATSQKPKVFIKKLVEYYEQTNSNIHRGIHYLSEKATSEYEESKRKVASFINAKSENEIIYTRNTSESLNLIAYTWAMNRLKKGDIVLSSEMEHHSNIVPWQIAGQRRGIKLQFIPVKDDYTLDLEVYGKLLEKKPKLVTFVHASNVLGTINPVKKMVAMAHKVGAITLIDGAQSVPHMPVDMQDLGCDFFAFSAHKMCGPTGIGVLYGKESFLKRTDPFLAGGDMISTVTFKKSTWNKLPWKFEAGTSNIADGIAFGTSIDYLKQIGMKNIEKHERELTAYALNQMSTIEGLEVFGQDNSVHERGGMVTFTLKCAHPHDIAHILNEEGIAIRSGNHCAQPLHSKFHKAATARVSFYLYNTKEEIDKLIEALHKVCDLFGK